MKRFLTLGAAVALVALTLVLPRVGAERLAALEAHAALTTAGEDTAGLGERLLRGPAALADDEGGLRLTLDRVRLRAPDGADTAALHATARASVVRGLRQEASRLGLDLVVVGDREASPETAGGVSIDIVLGEGQLEATASGPALGSAEVASVPWVPPSRTSVLPPLIAIALAILLRKPVPSLLCGVFAGAFLLRLRGGFSALASVPLGLRDGVTELLWPEVVSPARYMIVLFVVFMLALVGVVTVNGGVRGVMDRIARLASSASRTQFATYLMGLVVFFDDYANTILVGSTMRPLSDRWKVSREKLAYLIDSTAAPVAGLAVLSTWIAFEVSTFSAQLPAAGLTPGDGYAVFLQSLPYRFYCILTLVFVGLVAYTGRDFGPMARAEARARRGDGLVRPGGEPLVAEQGLQLEPAPNVQPRAWAAVVPILAFVLVTLFEIAHAGKAFELSAAELWSIEGLTGVLYDGSGSQPLMIGSLVGLLLAIAISRHLRVPGRAIVGAAWRVLTSMGVAIAILYLAWMIGRVCGSLGTAPYLTALLGDALDPRLLPAVLFLLAGVVAFSTGSSWSTMSILLPLVVGLAYALGSGAELGATPHESGMLLMLMSIGAVLEGAIFGDHCSPISDTTVLSSIAAASDHIDHVRTQIPYATVTMGVAMGAGYLPCTYLGVSPFLGLALGAALLTGVVLLGGRTTGPEASGS